MYKKLILCLIIVSLGSFGFDPGCGNSTDIRYDVYSNTSNATADIEYLDKDGNKKSISSNIHWFYKSNEFSDPNNLYLHVSNLTPEGATANASIKKNGETIKYAVYNDQNSPCNMGLSP